MPERSAGFIKIDRNLQWHPVFQNSAALQSFIKILLNVVWADCTTVISPARRKVVVKLAPGQWAARLRLIAHDLDLDKDTIARRLTVLEKLECIKVRKNKTHTLITVPNWARYQGLPSHPPEGVRASETPTGTHKKKVKKGKNIQEQEHTCSTDVEHGGHDGGEQEKPDYSQDFERLWSHCPRKVGNRRTRL